MTPDNSVLVTRVSEPAEATADNGRRKRLSGRSPSGILAVGLTLGLTLVGLCLTSCTREDFVTARVDAEGQGSSTLSRPVAARLINNYKPFTNVEGLLFSGQEAHDGAIKEGLLTRNDKLTEEGRRYFRISESGFGLLPTSPTSRAVVEVTGIAEAGVGLKEVHFTWKYTALDDVVARYIGQGAAPHTGVASVRLYDDGWRVEGVTALNENKVPFRSDPVRVKATYDLEQAELRARQERERLAKTSTRVILDTGFTLGRLENERLIIGDADVTNEWYDITSNWTRSGEQVSVDRSRPTMKVTYLFADLQRIFCGSGVQVQNKSGRHFQVGSNPSNVTAVREACDALLNAYHEWRNKYPEFAQQGMSSQKVP